MWLASTSQGEVCVLKFSDDKTLKKEAALWNKAWPLTEVKVTTLNGCQVLVMLWVKPCSEE